MTRLGIERVVERGMDPIRNDRVGLITNPSGVDSNMVTTIDRLHRHDDVSLVRLFAPKHGIRGDKQADVQVEGTIDEQTGIPVTSLYGDNRRLDSSMINGFDSVVYDVQDIGCRFYTHIDTLVYGLQGSVRADARFVVLDRPNPIAPLGIDGNSVQPEFGPFHGDPRLPITHGMTIGELARYFNQEYDLGADLHVVELDGWTRDTWYDELELAWVPPSPNMPTLDTATIYPGTCLFEATNFSEGRGTTKPFEVVGAPWVDADEWATVLNDLDLEGAAFRPAYFSPMFSKHERRDVEGVQVHVMDRDRIAPVEIGIKMLLTAFQLYPDAEWLRPGGDYFIDQLFGGPSLRRTIVDADSSQSSESVYTGLEERWAAKRDPFEQSHEEFALYA